MTDPFWMVLVLRRLGPGYVGWDRASEITFVAPGRSTVRAEFVVPDQLVADDGTVVARVRKQLYIRQRREVSERVGA